MILICSLLFPFSVFAQGIIFSEDFEESSPVEIAKNWSTPRNHFGMEISSDVPASSPGNQSLMMIFNYDENDGGYLYKMFDRGYDQLYARFYVKFAESHHPVHHFVHMGGYNPPTPWPQGGAGERPEGDKRFTTGIEPFGNSWSWDFYTYWMHMRTNPSDTYYGNDFLNPDENYPEAKIKRGEWICVEFMMKMNDPISEFNGEQAFWINGEKILHLKKGQPRGFWIWDSFNEHADSSGFEGFQWRNDEELNINFFWLLYYMTSGESGQKDTVWFDDVVVSTEYIGPNKPSSVFDSPAKHTNFQVIPSVISNDALIKIAGIKSDKIKIDLCDIYGNVIKEIYRGDSYFDRSIRFDFSELNSGIYFVRLNHENGIISRKIIILK